MTTVGLVANIYNEIHALPGWIETHIGFFDDVHILHAGPGGAYSNDGTIELLEKWKIPVEFCAIDEGFGVVRSRAIRMSPCDWTMILDADERFYPVHRMMTCTGEATPHSEVDSILQSYDFRDLASKPIDWDNIARLGANLRVEFGDTYDQGACLREAISSDAYDAIVTTRRHWHDFSFRKPTQNWHKDPDYQLRLVRNNGTVCFDSSVKMHERLIGVREVLCAESYRLYFDHLHFPFKRMEMEQRAHDVMIYDAIHRGEKPPICIQGK